MNGVVVQAERSLGFVSEADAVIVGSGVKSVEIANDAALLAQVRLDSKRQLVASQCSGALLLAKLGLLAGRPACTHLSTKKWVIEAGVRVIDRPFHTEGNVATAGGCLASQYLAAWIILRLGSREDFEMALHRVSPVGEQAAYLARAIAAVEPYLPLPALAAG